MITWSNLESIFLELYTLTTINLHIPDEKKVVCFCFVSKVVAQKENVTDVA